MPSISIAESFDRPLPIGTVGEESPKAHVSGPSTLDADPPGFAFPVPFSTWNHFADQLLHRTQELADHRLASWEQTRLLRVEANVSDAAAVQLINPVDLAFSTLYAAPIKCANQLCRGTARTDKCWMRDQEQIPFAVMDYKRPGVIRREEFEDAFVLPEDYATEARHVQAQGGLFEDNASIIMKQAVNYAEQYGTNYVAFFDWKTLLLIVLEQREVYSGGMWCCVSLIRDRKQMRRALLGFLYRAYCISVDGHPLPPLLPAVGHRRARRNRG
ncbi:hypothetical protein FDECE_10747 [Fusarium decemcellulare]|nr:hypothetical protein FDECE_10747 [Fusarium decemcellulare]